MNWVIEHPVNDLSLMIQRFNSSQASQIMVEAVPDHLVDQYGIVDVASSPLEALHIGHPALL